MQRNKKYIHRQNEAEKKEDYLKIVQNLSGLLLFQLLETPELFRV